MNGDTNQRLTIKHGDHWVEEHRYILDVLLKEHLGLPYQAQVVSGLDWVEISCPSAGEKRGLKVAANLLLSPSDSWLKPAMMPELPLESWNPAELLTNWRFGPLPVLFPARRSTPGREEMDPACFIPLDLFGGAFFLLTRCEEIISTARDRHGRFRAADSVAYKAGFLLHPVVDGYARLLGMALEAIFPGLRCREFTPRIRLSHDVDRPYEYFHQPVAKVMAVAGAKAARSRSPSQMVQVMRAAVTSGFLHRRSADPSNNYWGLMDVSEAMHSQGEFYFKGGATNRRYDDHYDLLSADVQSLFRDIHDRGHIIGLHPSYDAFSSQTVLAAELQNLRQALQHAGLWNQRIGGRQHYLRWENPTTWRCWDEAGLDYDSTLGFADHIGFRCGTSREYPVFDLLHHRQLRLRERPLIAMDVSMVEYMGLSEPEIAQALRMLWSTICQVGGTLEILIHPSNPMAMWMAQMALELSANQSSAPAMDSQFVPNEPAPVSL